MFSGAGEFSTTLLDQISQESNRMVLTADHDMVWLDKFELQAQAECHQFEFVELKHGEDTGENWGTVGTGQKWSIAFVDQKPGY